MKKFLLIVITLGGLVALSAKEVQITEVLDKYIMAWNEHDIEKIDMFYAEDVIWYDLAYDYTTKGRKEVSKAITDAFMGNVTDMFWGKNGDVFISDNTIIYEWVYGGTFNGKLDGTTIKDIKFSIKGISTTSFDKKGKIISHKDYYDLFTLKKQLGVVK